jgi:hypothetical protein
VRALFPDTQSTDTQATQYFFPEWVTGVFYGGHWEQVKLGTYQEGIPTDHGDMVTYVDPFDDEIVFVLEPITGYRVKKPQPPPEPQASVTELYPK